MIMHVFEDPLDRFGFFGGRWNGFLCFLEGDGAGGVEVASAACGSASRYCIDVSHHVSHKAGSCSAGGETAGYVVCEERGESNSAHTRKDTVRIL